MDLVALAAQLEAHEGLRLKPYKDSVGKLTIGVGRNLDDVGISEAEARVMLWNDMQRTLSDCRGFAWFDRLTAARKMVVADMVFNLGLAKFRGFKRMIAAMEAGDYEAAVAEMAASRWAHQVGRRAHRLMDMMLHG